MKRFLFYILALALPFVALLLVEVGLRAVGVERAARTPFVSVPTQPSARALNPDYVARYFPNFVPAVAFTPLAVAKPDDVFRVVALGGSSTAGFPYQFYSSFPSRLQSRLEDFLPSLRIEVVNLGMTAVNSYTLWDLREAVAAQNPDAVVIYAGHNEYYGAFGVGSAANRLVDSVPLKRLALDVKRTALGATLDGWLRGSDADQGDGRTLMARMVGDAQVARGSDAYVAGVEQYARNMEAVLATMHAGDIPVYLGTLTSNLKDQPPLGDDPDALTAFERGAALFADGDTAAARAAFAEAKELDPVRFRAPDTLNALIHSWDEHDGVTVVDVADAFVAASPSGIEDAALFVDHLHPNAVGYDLMATTFFDALRSHPRLRAYSQEFASHRSASAAPVDPVESAHVRLQLVQLMSGYPFDKTATPDEAARRYGRALEHALRSGQYADSLAAVALTTGRSMLDVLGKALGRAESAGDTATTLRLFRSILHWQPFNEDLMERAVGYALASPTYDAETLPLARFAANRTDALFHHNALAALHLRQGQTDDAQRFLTYVEGRAPSNPTMLYNTARLYLADGDTTAARGYFSRYQQQASPNSATAR